MARRPDPARDRVARLLRLARGRRRALIAAQDRPDPDGMASAVALKRLLRDKARLDVVIATAGEVGRAENRAILQLLGEPFEDLASLDLPSFDLRALVDAQPGFGNNSWPPDVEAHLILDHHPRGPGIPRGALADIRPKYGATSTILTEYLRAAQLPLDPQLATALLYGIKTDTQDLGRDAAPADTKAFLFLYPRANHRLLAKIERERLPRHYFAVLARALLACRLYDTVALCPLGHVESPDILAELADFFLRIEGVRWTLCHGLFEGKLHLSLRTIVRQGNAGALMAALVKDLGTGGGHDMMAGGQVPLDDTSAGSEETYTREIELRLLRALDVPTRSPEPLVPESPRDDARREPPPEGPAKPRHHETPSLGDGQQ